MNLKLNIVNMISHIKKSIPAKILCLLMAVPIKVPSGMNSNTELRPGPNVIPKALIPTKIADILLYAQISIFIARYLRVNNLDPPIPKIILPAINIIKPDCFFPVLMLTVSAK